MMKLLPLTALALGLSRGVRSPRLPRWCLRARRWRVASRQLRARQRLARQPRDPPELQLQPPVLPQRRAPADLREPPDHPRSLLQLLSPAVDHRRELRPDAGLLLGRRSLVLERLRVAVGARPLPA